MSKFLDSLFSISDYQETHKIVKILGIKIKFPKKEYINKLKACPYLDYKKNNADITTLPPAEGQMRDIQLANLRLLEELDYVCRKNNLQYWLDFGSMLGAVRHKGYIPWDDDIDVSMMRDDYDKIIKAFESTSTDSDIYAEYTRLKRSQIIIKVKHKKCDALFVDIFPMDYSNKQSGKDERLNITKNLIKIRKRLSHEKFKTQEELLNELNNIRSKNIPNKYIEQSDIQRSTEFNYTEPVWVYKYDTIFPLKEYQFENFTAMGVNKAHEYLSEIMGNYMNYPNKIGFAHSAYLNFPDEELQIIKKLAQESKKY